MFEPTSVIHHFVLNLRKADLSTAQWSSSFVVVTGSGQGSEPDYKTTWRISWLPDRPALELVEDMTGSIRPKGCSTRLRSSTTVATTLIYDGAADHQTASPITGGRASWEPHASLLGWSTEVERCTLDGNVLTKLVMGSQSPELGFRISVRIGEPANPEVQLARVRLMKEHRMMSTTLEQVRSAYLRTHLARNPHNLRLLFLPSRRVLYENAAFLRSHVPRLAQVLAPSGSFSDLDFGCVAGARTFAVVETSGNTYEAYEVLLEWLRFGRIQFGDYHAPDLVLTRDQGTAMEEDDSPIEILAPVGHLRPALPPVHLENFSPSSAPNPEAMYRLADSLGIKALRLAAFEAFSSSLIPTSALNNLFSPFSRDFRPVADLCIDFCAVQREKLDLTRIRNLIDRKELAIGAVEGAELLSRLYVKIVQLEWQDKKGGDTVCPQLPGGWL
ncbi:BQ5605_C014g07473 [Microbotryum silenes-dioicae]|uniref:BQ5605_C014g07473 protein n=1 Tax=Microbotryum silenes-dioicae TaxID=796604 RepID=A0A2X0LXM9_9BASI|nr:BQ5605_C014g07473 [Microbotryum silenes-dioicae]